MVEVFNLILDWVYPPACIACRALLPLNDAARRASYFCEHCESLPEVIGLPVCRVCGAPSSDDIDVCGNCINRRYSFTCNHAAFVYEGILQEILRDIKFRNRRRGAEGLGALWARALADKPVPEADYIVPLPMHRKKQRQRGFNQAEIMAKYLSELYEIPMISALERTRNTPPQSGLSTSRRADNVRGVFEVADEYVENLVGKKIILVDDIFTTGASLNECANILKLHGVGEVQTMTLCIAVRGGGSLLS